MAKQKPSRFSVPHKVAQAQQSKTVRDITTGGQFQQLVEQSEQPALVDFWAEWCGPCKATAPAFAAAAENYKGRVGFFKVNTETAPALAQKFGVRSIPTLLMLHQGEVVDVHIGASNQAQIERMAEGLLKRVAKVEKKVAPASAVAEAEAARPGLWDRITGMF